MNPETELAAASLESLQAPPRHAMMTTTHCMTRPWPTRADLRAKRKRERQNKRVARRVRK